MLELGVGADDDDAPLIDDVVVDADVALIMSNDDVSTL
jgi:hypothetical protein